MKKKSVPFSMIGGLERYPEFENLVNHIVKQTVQSINSHAPAVESEVPYKKQFVIEEVIKKLQEISLNS